MPGTTASKVLVLGASGYVGGRLVPLLLDKGYKVKAAARNVDKLSCREYANHPGFEPVMVNVLDRNSLDKACEDCRAAFYLVHSMGGPGKRKNKDFAFLDRQAAQNMTLSSEKAGMRQIIYLGGLGEEGQNLSSHLKSRLEVGNILQKGKVPATFLKAAMILGSGSASFEVMRYLVERLPVMITPRWVHTNCQPIAVTNVLGYLTGCLDNPETIGQSFDIGGPDILSYAHLFQIYAQEAGLRERLIIPVPVLSPRLSSYWIHLVTPVPAKIASPLAEGLKNTVICRENRIREIIPQELLSCREAIRRALDRLKKEEVDTCWSDAGTVRAPEWLTCSDSSFSGGNIYELGYEIEMDVPRERIWQVIEGVGGKSGWYYANFLWRTRGMIDRFLGGTGYREGRRPDQKLRYGDAVDFWRVVQVKKNEQLKFAAEMKVPGEAVLEFEIIPGNSGKNLLVQRARFYPKGLWGLVYWKCLLPVHKVLFRGMLKRIAANAGAPAAKKPVSARQRDHCDFRSSDKS